MGVAQLSLHLPDTTTDAVLRMSTWTNVRQYIIPQRETRSQKYTCWVISINLYRKKESELMEKRRKIACCNKNMQDHLSTIWIAGAIFIKPSLQGDVYIPIYNRREIDFFLLMGIAFSGRATKRKTLLRAGWKIQYGSLSLYIYIFYIFIYIKIYTHTYKLLRTLKSFRCILE